MMLAMFDLERRPRLAGALIALAGAIKPQIALLAPVALIAGGALGALVSAVVVEMLLVAAMAALTEAAADTVSSELGQATARGAYMITDFRDVPIGTNGAISVEGTFSGCVAACIISWVSAASGLVDWRWTPVIAFAGIGGMFLDSIMGATWENYGKIGNDTVNFVSTVFAADVALVVALIVERVGG